MYVSEFKNMLRATEKNTPRKVKQKNENKGQLTKQRLSVPDLDATMPMFSTEKEDGRKTEGKASGLFGKSSKMRKALDLFTFSSHKTSNG